MRRRDKQDDIDGKGKKKEANEGKTEQQRRQAEVNNGRKIRYTWKTMIMR